MVSEGSTFGGWLGGGGGISERSRLSSAGGKMYFSNATFGSGDFVLEDAASSLSKKEVCETSVVSGTPSATILKAVDKSKSSSLRMLLTVLARSLLLPENSLLRTLRTSVLLEDDDGRFSDSGFASCKTEGAGGLKELACRSVGFKGSGDFRLWNER